MNFPESWHEPPGGASESPSLLPWCRSRNHHEEPAPTRGGEQEEAASEPRAKSFPFACPNPSEYFLLNEVTGEIIPKGCGLQTCAACIFLIIWQTVGAIRLACPSYMIRLSHTGETWSEIRRNLQQFNRAMRSALGAHEWAACFVVHENPSGDGQTHVHLLARAQRLDSDLVQEKAINVGVGRSVNVQSIGSRGLSYPFHPITDTRDLDHESACVEIKGHLAINGERPVHATTNFWLAPDGRPSTLKDARAASSTTDAWTVIRHRPEAA